PKVLEFNCRFGDPETQSILPLLESDLFATLLACTREELPKALPVWRNKTYTCGVVVASGGYPASATKGQQIRGVDDAQSAGCLVFHAGTEFAGGNYLTAGGRVL